MKARFLALAALVLGLASCQQEFNGVAQLGGEVDFQLKVDAAELATRAGAYGSTDNNNAYDSAFGAIDYLQGGNGVDEYRVDWTEVDLRYSLEVYDADVINYNNADVKPVKDRMVKIVDAYEQVVFDLRLVPGRDYRFVVFADFVPNGEYDKEIDPSIEYQDDLGLRHRIGDDLRDITIIEHDNNNAAVNQINDEIGDAYFYTDVVENLHTNSSQVVTLQRPYGKLRVIATDLAELNLNVEPKSVKVQYESSRPVGFNAVTGKVTSELLEETTYFSVYNEGVCKLIDIDKNANGLANHFYNAGYDNATTENADGVKRHTHMTLFTDYILGSNTLGEQTPVHFTMSVYDDKNGQSLIKETIFNTTIPIERNHLTTIVGNVLTSATEITVTINDNFANANNTTDTPFYQQTISNEAELLAAIEANSGEYILVSDIKVDGIPASTLATTRSTGNGTTINLNDKIIILKTNIEVKSGNTLTITDNGQIIKDGGQIVNNGTLNIEGGNFGENTIQNNGTANVSGGNFADKAIVNNGSVSVEGDNSGEEDRIIVNDGEDAVVTNIVYTVEELQAALDEGKVDEIIFGADLVGDDATISQREGVNVYINGANKKFDGTIYVHGGSRNNGAETLKIANINFETESAKYFIYANYRTEPERYAHNVTIENCTFTSLAGDNSVQVCGASFRQAFNVTIKNCTATNTFYLAWFTGSVGTTIEGCKAINNYEGITVGNGTTSVVKNTEISSSTYGLRVESNHSNYSDTHNVTIENCKLNAFIPVSVRNLTSGKFNLTLSGQNTLTRGGLFDIALCANEYKNSVAPNLPTGEWSIVGADNFVVYPRNYASTNDELNYAVANAQDGTVIYVNNGTYDMPFFTNKELSFEGIGENVIFNEPAATQADKKYAGSKISFKNVTIDGTKFGNTPTSHGFVGLLVETYTDCTIKDYFSFAGDEVTVNSTTFVGQEAQYFWTGLSNKLTFNNCSFNCVDRALNVCSHVAGETHEVTFNNCNFNATKLEKSVLEIDGSYGPYTINLNNCTATGFKNCEGTGEYWFNIKKNPENVTFKVNGNTWISEGLYTDADNNYLIYSVAGLNHFSNTQVKDGTVIKLATDIDFNGAEFKAIAADYSKSFTFDGQNHTIKNVKLVTSSHNSVGAASLFFCFTDGTINISNLVVENATSEGGTYAGTILGYTQGNATLKNITVKDSTISGVKKIGGLVGFVEASTTSFIAENCHIVNTKVVATEKQAGTIIGYNAKPATLKGCTVDTDSTATAPTYCDGGVRCTDPAQAALTVE